MSDNKAAGSLFHLVAFDMRISAADDGAGNYEGGWSEQFRSRAEFIHLRGSETVLAGRLQGRHTQIIRIRSSSNSRLITASWRVRDLRHETVFNVRDVEVEENRQFISLTCESGVATG